MGFRPCFVRSGVALLSGVVFVGASSLQAQEDEEEVFELSPFTVEGSDDEGYRATHTLAGTRIRTDLKDVGSAISVVTEEFLRDTAATDNRSLLQYTVGTEVGGVEGNFAGSGDGVTLSENFQNPSTNTRVRGLAQADNTRNYFLTSIPWDGYNVDRVDLQRGPNAILFGFGSPAGIINVTLAQPMDSNEGEVGLRFDDQGSTRATFDLNRVILEDELAVRFSLLKDDEKFRQEPAFEDDQRFYGAVKYTPKFLQSEANTSRFNAYFETGEIDSNRPRSITPQDRISAWFRPVHVVPGDLSSPYNPEGGIGKGLFTPEEVENNNDMSLEFVGQNRKTWIEDGSPNPYYIPALGNFGQSFGGPFAFFDSQNAGVVDTAFQSEFRGNNGLGPDGEIDGDVGGLPFARMTSVDSFSSFARDADLPFSDFGQYRDATLSDTSIFDFYNHLLDGPNKEEHQEWDNFNFSYAQTFLDNKLGFELAYDRQDYYEYQTSIITDSRQAIFIDTNSELTDGTPNPNAGRPFITDSAQFGNNSRETERESMRATAFAEYDFTDRGDDSWWRRLLGRQVFTGLYSEDENLTENFGWQRHTMGQDFRDFVGDQSIRSNINAFNPVIYLGPSLVDRDSAVGANIPGVTGEIVIPDQVNVRVWDSTWNSPGVDPGAWWDDNGDGVQDEGETQSENPANYVGWTSHQFSVEKATPENPYPLATSGSLVEEVIESEALILQNYFWEGAVVGTYGWRKDTAEGRQTNAGVDNATQRALIEEMELPEEANIVSQQSQSWSVAAHLNQMFGLDESLPINVSLYYNESENFQPAANRVDMFGRSLGPPSGDTIDRSILLSTKENRYSLKITRFTTELRNSSASGIAGTWFLGALEAWGTNWADIFEFDIDNATIGNPTGENTYAPLPGQTEEEAAAFEAAAIAGWRQHRENVAALAEELTGNPNAYDEAWSWTEPATLTKNGISTTAPAGLSFTEDSVTEGYEFEFYAQPTEGWTVTLNAAKIEATRNNVGGEALLRYVELVNDDLNNTPAGDLRIWWGGAGSTTTLQEWNNTFNAPFNLTKLLEGTATPELREWRVNMVTNYSFQDGAFSGFNVGGGYRWQDDVIIGYPPMYTDETQTDVTFDLDDPYTGPAEDAVDFWIGYGKALSDNIDWRIQLNVRNLLADKDDLIPITTNADGSVAAWRIAPTTSWTVTNTFSF